MGRKQQDVLLWLGGLGSFMLAAWRWGEVVHPKNIFRASALLQWPQRGALLPQQSGENLTFRMRKEHVACLSPKSVWGV